MLYSRDGQTTEDEMFSNGAASFVWCGVAARKTDGLRWSLWCACPSAVDASPAFYEFLDLLGTRIQLQGWTGYRGGLDVQSRRAVCRGEAGRRDVEIDECAVPWRRLVWDADGTTGRESVFAKWRGLDIMLHVSTLLPFDPVNPQQVHDWGAAAGGPATAWYGTH